MAVPIHIQAPKLRERIGWEMHVPGGFWPTIVRVDVEGPYVLITCSDGVGYRVGYLDAVKVRAPGQLSERFGPDEPVDEECDGADRP